MADRKAPTPAPVDQVRPAPPPAPPSHAPRDFTAALGGYRGSSTAVPRRCTCRESSAALPAPGHHHPGCPLSHLPAPSWEYVERSLQAIAAGLYIGDVRLYPTQAAVLLDLLRYRARALP